MKLARIGPKGRERPVAVDRHGRYRSLAGQMSDLTSALLGPDKLGWITAIDIDALPIIETPARIGIPIADIGKLVCIGLNYADHAREANLASPKEPIIFFKANTALAGPNDAVPMPRGATRLDWEVELGVVIGTRARYVAREAALDHVAGYVLVNDISERSHQLERGGAWDKGKSHDGAGPVGPWLVTRDELHDATGLEMFCNVSGTRRQSGSTSSMIFDVSTIVSYVSEFMTLMPGDVIATGTPAGVGMGFSPPVYLTIGDEMHLGISGLGEQRQRVVAAF